MKNNIKWFLIAMFSCYIFASCVDPDDYMKYLEGGEIVYPQKPDSVKAYPGKNRIELEWIMIDPRVTSCVVYYEQAGIMDSVIVNIDPQNFTNDTIRKIIPNLEETSYRFRLVSHDDYGHTSIHVEAEGSVYGEIYENGLVNRVVRDKIPMPDGLRVDWYDADQTEIAVKINYTDLKGNPKEILMPDSIKTVLLSDCDMTLPFFYQTLYKPVPIAIDTFYTNAEEGQYIFPTELSNTTAPFILTSEGLWFSNRWGTPVNWIINDAARQNGTVDSNFGHSISMWAWQNLSPAITNGKIYQVLLLEPGSYRFIATVETMSATVNEEYLAVALSTTLPDTEQIRNQSLAFQQVTAGSTKGTQLECNFELATSNVVTLGLVGNIDQGQETGYNKFELIKN